MDAGETPGAESEAWEEVEISPPEQEDPLPLLLHLYANGDYQGVRTEALEAAFESEGDQQAELRYLAALAELKLSGDRGRAHSELEALSREYADQEIGELAQLALANAWLEVAPRLGVVQYQAFLEQHPDSSYAAHAAARAAYGLASEGQFSMALSQLEGHSVPTSPELSAMLADPPAWKRPVVATFLSGAVPGAGQLYAGQPKEAFSAAFVNGLFIAGSVYAARNENWAALGTTAFFGLGFYSGNIYGAADAAIRHNRAIRDEILGMMEAEDMGPGQPPLPSVAE